MPQIASVPMNALKPKLGHSDLLLKQYHDKVCKTERIIIPQTACSANKAHVTPKKVWIWWQGQEIGSDPFFFFFFGGGMFEVWSVLFIYTCACCFLIDRLCLLSIDVSKG